MKYLLMAAEIVLTPVLYLALTLLLGLAVLPAAIFVQWAHGYGFVFGVIALGPGFLLFGFCLMFLVVVVKWGFFYHSVPGQTPFLCWHTARWVAISKLYDMTRFSFLWLIRGTWMFNMFLRALGAKIGSNVIIGTANVNDWDLLEIGDNTMIGGDAVILGHVGEKGLLKKSPVKIGNNCTVGQNSVVMPGVVMEDGSVLGAMSVATKGKTLPVNTVWGGTDFRLLRAKGGRAPVVMKINKNETAEESLIAVPTNCAL